MPIKCVKAIHSGTNIRSLEQWAYVINRYMNTYWEGCDEAELFSVLDQLLFGNRVFYQCRLNGKHKILKETWTKA